MATDPRTIIDREPMSGFQWGIVAIMVGLNALDGFDVQSIAFASPGIASEWGIDRAALGFVLSMELFGMSIGSLLLGGLADKLGRRWTILGCLMVMAAGMFAAATAHDVTSLSLWRVLTGLGIGGMLAAINAAVAEAANAKRRSLCVVVMAAGYPVGAVVGGMISSALLVSYDWRAIFIFGGLVTLAFIPIVLWRSPESIAFEMHRGGREALERINRTLARMGHAAVAALPDHVPAPKGMSTAQLFARDYRWLTIGLAAVYFTHLNSFYYIMKWTPKLVADLGFAPSAAAGVLVWTSIGGTCGALLLGLLSLRIKVASLTMVAMVIATIAIVVFGQGWTTLPQLSIAAAAAGFWANAPIVGLYAIAAQSFPTHLRAGATGFVIGIGRLGAMIAPALAGILFKSGYSLATVSLVMGLGSTVAAAMLFAIRRRVA